MEKSQAESCVCDVGPAESTGKPRSRYCPGGSLPLVSLCSYFALVYHAQTFSRLKARGARWTLPLLLLPGESWLLVGETCRGANALITAREPSRHYTGSETIIRLSTSVTPEAE